MFACYIFEKNGSVYKRRLEQCHCKFYMALYREVNFPGRALQSLSAEVPFSNRTTEIALLFGYNFGVTCLHSTRFVTILVTGAAKTCSPTDSKWGNALMVFSIDENLIAFQLEIFTLLVFVTNDTFCSERCNRSLWTHTAGSTFTVVY